MKHLRVGIALGLTVLLGAAAASHAGTNGFIVPPWRGQAGSQAGYWEFFTVPVGAPGNQADRAGATTGAVLTQTNGLAFLTGSGNIYNLDGVSAFELADAPPFQVGTVVVQMRSLGSEIDSASVTLLYTDGSGMHSVAPSPRVELNRGNQPGLGATVSSLWQWDLSGLGISSYVIRFQAAAPSLSFDSLTLDASSQFTPLFTEPFHVHDAMPALDRWMYANNAAPCDRPAGSVFGTFGDDAGVDTRHAQQLVGWDTAALMPTNRGPARYLVRRCRLTLTINRGNLFTYDATADGFHTYFETNHAEYVPDADAGRPVEFFGVGFRHGYNAATFDQCAPFGTNVAGERNAYAAGYSTAGVLVDVGNNVGKTNAAFPRFEAVSFAVGQITNVAPGQLVPAGAKVSFELNLADPLVLGYVQAGLNTGRLRFMVSSLHSNNGQTGAPAYPDFATRFSEAVIDPTQLDLDGVVEGSGDVDQDGLADDWENFYLNTLTFVGTNDGDGDGLSNAMEYLAGTDPSQAASVLRLGPIQGATGEITLFISHAASRSYRAESTVDFQSWTPLAVAPVFAPGTGRMKWTDTITGTPRFYQVRVSPLTP